MPAGQTSSPVVHRRVEEIWYVLHGRGTLEAPRRLARLGLMERDVTGLPMIEKLAGIMYGK